MDAAGVDDCGNVFESPNELWERAADAQWYIKAVDYWDQQEASVNGVLGGYGHLSVTDVRDSRAFLRKVGGSRASVVGMRWRLSKAKVEAFGAALAKAEAGQRQLAALDCGAGVGRVTEQLLLQHFHEVDLVEPSAHLIDEARRRLGNRGNSGTPRGHRAVNFYQQGLEKHHPVAGRYDVIWLQWAALYLTDADLVAFLQRSAAALKDDGMLFVKENVTDKGFIVDNSDASVTRSHQYYVQLFDRAGLRMMHTALQKDFPKGLFKVRMYALRSAS